ncbi:MAG: polymer-forming cytoskeletal protein [Candidatus Baltobacteraceae bacterium]
MNTRFTILSIVAAFIAVLVISTGVAQAAARSVSHGGNYMGSVYVEPGQVVDGDLNVLFGNATIDGTVTGDVNVVGGSVIERPGSRVDGNANAIGGGVVESMVPWAPSADASGVGNTDWRLTWRIAWDVVVLVFFLIFPLRTRLALDRLEQHPGLATAAGLFGWVAVIPIMILLAVTIVLIPLIPLELVALVAGVFIGKAALSLLIGRRFYELLQPNATPSPVVALAIGLVLLTAAEMVPVVGVLVTCMVGLVGLGAVILTFVRDQPTPFAGTFAGGTTARPPVGGPPMPVA